MIFGLLVLFDNFARRRGWKSGPRYSTWYWRRWWRFAYNSGLYQFTWLWQKQGISIWLLLLPHLRVWRTLR